MSAPCPPRRAPRSARQRGQAMLLTVLLVAVGVSAVIYNFVAPAKQSIERERITAAALAQAKAALIGFAVGIQLDGAGSPRVGDLPCPDISLPGSVNEGVAGGSCSNGGGTTIGRLPWRTLGLPDLRDGSGERLWYAVTESFKNNPAIGTLNSESRGGITVRDRNGMVIRDGTNPDPFTPSGAIAVVIAPGDMLRRQGAGAAQDRTGAAQLVATNYLDLANVGGNEDNANFLDSTANGFINGDILDANGSVIVNDRLIAIRYDELMPLMERRVAGEALKCLTSFASANGGRYPWAAPITDTAPPYGDVKNTRFGRVPDPPLTQTKVGQYFNVTILGIDVSAILNTVLCLLGPPCFNPSFPAAPSCNLSNGTWWTHWKDQVFYAMGAGYEPALSLTVSLLPPFVNLSGTTSTAACSAGNCMTVNPPSAAEDKHVIIMVAGKRLSTQGARPSANAADYLEGENNTTANTVYTRQTQSTTFNDTVVFK